jgi:hypothetical protein
VTGGGKKPTIPEEGELDLHDVLSGLFIISGYGFSSDIHTLNEWEVWCVPRFA